jgi:hypothetical protein
MSWAVASVVMLVGIGTGTAVVTSCVGFGVGSWSRAEVDGYRVAAVLAFPLFAWPPLVATFGTLLALRHGTAIQVAGAWLVLVLTGTLLWRRGRQLEARARNPLRGILDAPA